MTNTPSSKHTSPISWGSRILTYAIVLLVGAAIGFVPMWLQARNTADELSQAKARLESTRTQNALESAAAARQLGAAEIQNMLASAAIDAWRGDYEAARQAASAFFVVLREETSKEADSILTQAQKDGVEPMFARRDETISLLARNDPAAAERLSDLYVAFRELMGG
jgi:hypothetical protein